MLDFNISTTCAKDSSKCKLFFSDDHDMLKEDVEDYNLKELFEDDEITRLMANCVICLSFVLLQDCNFWNFILCVFFKSLLHKQI
jgi:hypothetical protein